MSTFPSFKILACSLQLSRCEEKRNFTNKANDEIAAFVFQPSHW